MDDLELMNLGKKLMVKGNSLESLKYVQFRNGMFFVTPTPEIKKDFTSADIVDVNIYNENTTKLTFSDGSSTVSTCKNGDVFSFSEGIALCILKHLINTEANKSITKAVELYDRAQAQKLKDIADKQAADAILANKIAREAKRKAKRKIKVDQMLKKADEEYTQELVAIVKNIMDSYKTNG